MECLKNRDFEKIDFIESTELIYCPSEIKKTLKEIIFN